MADDIVDLEQECEDALFELSDTRERYPAKCANELAKCLQLTTQIIMKPVKPNKYEKLEKPVITNSQKELFEKTLSKKNEIDEPLKWNEMSKKIVNLRMVVDQIENDKPEQVI